MSATMTLREEAQALSQRTGLRWQACQAWMIYAGITAVTDLMRRYPGTEHAEAMRRAGEEIETFILEK